MRVDDPWAIWFYRCVLGVFLIGPGLMAWRTFKDWLKGRRSLIWPSATGVVKDSMIHVYKARNEGERTLYEPQVTYEYEVVGLRFENKKQSYNPLSLIRSEIAAKDFIEKFRPGSRVEVFYDPENPKESVLKKGSRGGFLRSFGLFLVAVFAGYCLWLIGW